MAVETVSAERFEELLAAIESSNQRLAEAMDTEADALRVMCAAYERLKQLGWNDAIYCPKDGSSFDVIEGGSSGIHRAHYEGEWPTGSWWIEEAGDLWPSRPVLYRVTEAEKARWAALRHGLSACGAQAEQGQSASEGPLDGATPLNPDPSQ